METLRQVLLSSTADIDIIEVCSLPYIYMPEDEFIEKTCCVDVFYILDGTAQLMFNKSSVKDISTGDCIFLSRKKNDYFILSGVPDTVILHGRFLPVGMYQDLVMCQCIYEHLHIFRKESSDFLPAVAEMMRLLLRLYEKGVEEKLLLETPIALFFILLYITKSASGSFKCYNPEHVLSGLMFEIIKKPGYPWRVSDMAKRFNMNTNLFIREFKKVSGFTPFLFLKKIRLNRGKHLLENTETPVSVIAGECGYNSHASFAFYMKQEFGESPVKIRRSARKYTG